MREKVERQVVVVVLGEEGWTGRLEGWRELVEKKYMTHFRNLITTHSREGKNISPSKSNCLRVKCCCPTRLGVKIGCQVNKC